MVSLEKLSSIILFTKKINHRVYHIVANLQVRVYHIVVYHDQNFIKKITSGICRVCKLYLMQNQKLSLIFDKIPV